MTVRRSLWAALVAVFGLGLWAVAGWLQGLTVAALVAILGCMVERGRDPMSDLTDRRATMAVDEREALELIWNAALDASRSKDFRHEDGSLNEEAYLRYKENVFAEAIARLRATTEQQLQATEDAVEVAHDGGIHTYRVDDGYVVADGAGWVPGVYPTRNAAVEAAQTADALEGGDDGR